MVWSSRATRTPEIETSAMACHVIDDVQDAKAPSVRQLVMDEVERPAGIGLCVYKDRSPRSQSFPAAFPLAHGQSFLAIEPVDAIDARRLAFAPEQDEETAITEPPALIRKLA